MAKKKTKNKRVLWYKEHPGITIIQLPNLHPGVCLGGSQWGGGEVNKNSNCRAGYSNYKYLVLRAKYVKRSNKEQPDTMRPLFSSLGL